MDEAKLDAGPMLADLAEGVHEAAKAFGNAVSAAEAAGLIVEIEVERLDVRDYGKARHLTHSISTRVSKPL